MSGQQGYGQPIGGGPNPMGGGQSQYGQPPMQQQMTQQQMYYQQQHQQHMMAAGRGMTPQQIGGMTQGQQMPYNQPGMQGMHPMHQAHQGQPQGQPPVQMQQYHQHQHQQAYAQNIPQQQMHAHGIPQSSAQIMQQQSGHSAMGQQPAQQYVQPNPQLHSVSSQQMQPSPILSQQQQGPQSVVNPASIGPSSQHQMAPGSQINPPSIGPPSHQMASGSQMNPASIGPPSHQMAPASQMNPASIGPSSHQMAPGSQMNPASIGPPSHQMAPGSQMNPASIGAPHSQQMHHGPASVQQPGSVQLTHGPSSQMGPGSQQMTSSQGPHTPHNPVSQNPPSHTGMHSINATANPASVQPSTPASNLQASLPQQPRGGPASVQPTTPAQPASHQPMTPATGEKAPQSVSSLNASAVGSGGSAQPKEEPILQDDILIHDPVAQVKSLVLSDLRHKIYDLNRKSCDLIKSSTASSSGNATGPPTEKVEAYKQAHNDFMAVCDQIDASLVLTCEFRAQMAKMDKIFPPQQQTHQTQQQAPGQDPSRSELQMVQQINQYVNHTNSIQKMFSDTMTHVTGTMQRIRDRQDAYRRMNGLADVEDRMDEGLKTEID